MKTTRFNCLAFCLPLLGSLASGTWNLRYEAGLPVDSAKFGWALLI